MHRESTAVKIEELQYCLRQGKTKEEAAIELGFKDKKGLYKFVSNHNLNWNEEKGNYEAMGNDGLPIQAVKPAIENPTGKVSSIISMFNNGMDAREITKKLKFHSQQSMADYMKTNGYIWNCENGNYEKFAQEIKEAMNVKNKEKTELHITEGVISEKELSEPYVDLLKLLYENKDKLNELLNINDESTKGIVKTIPRYILPGVSIDKCVKISTSLDKLIKDFSEERKIHQRDIVEVALIDFFKKYDYADESRAVLNI
jgi:ribosomal protein S8